MVEWTTVKLSNKTRERLRAFLNSQIEWMHNGGAQLPWSGSPGKSEPSVDWQVNELLRRVEKHRERARKQRERRSLKLREAAQLDLDQADECITVVGPGTILRYRPRGMISVGLVPDALYTVREIESGPDHEQIKIGDSPWWHSITDFQEV